MKAGFKSESSFDQSRNGSLTGQRSVLLFLITCKHLTISGNFVNIFIEGFSSSPLSGWNAVINGIAGARSLLFYVFLHCLFA